VHRAIVRERGRRRGMVGMGGSSFRTGSRRFINPKRE
jgi:hypothetical protein